MSASSQCPHLEFRFQVNVARFETDAIKFADITGRCANCHRPVTFRCRLPVGLDWDSPTISPDATELRLPIVVQGDAVDETTCRPGYNIRRLT